MIIVDKISKDKKLNQFIVYIKKYLFKLNPEIYISISIINNLKKLYTINYKDKLFLSNIICKSINLKINFNLSNKNTNNYVL